MSDESKTVRLEITVTVDVDPNDDALLAQIRESNGNFSIGDIARAEIESTLESVSYVKHANAE